IHSFSPSRAIDCGCGAGDGNRIVSEISCMAGAFRARDPVPGEGPANDATVIVLGIETSCDDTATAVVRDGRDVLASVSTDQNEFHERYGGIVPEIASRRHVALLSAAVEN